jgi:RNA polymerase sigma-70 factor (ECF subfamily)
LKTSDLEKYIERLQQGDNQAFEVVYDCYSDIFYGICIKILGDEEKAKDALQDAFIKIWQHAKTFNKEKGSFFTWMLNVVRNTALDAYRKNARHPITAIQLETKNVSIVNDHSDTMNHIGLKELLNHLEEEQIEIIEQLFFRGLTQQEAAEKLKLPLGTIKTRSRTALIKLRKLF